MALFGRGRRVGEGLLSREERKSGLRGPISVFVTNRTNRAGLKMSVQRIDRKCSAQGQSDAIDPERTSSAYQFAWLLSVAANEQSATAGSLIERVSFGGGKGRHDFVTPGHADDVSWQWSLEVLRWQPVDPVSQSPL
jgi:hypothetical protein